MRRPSSKKANTRKRLELMLTAAMDWALFGRRPTNIVSSMAMLIQPISARTSGMARWRVGRSSERRVDQENMGNRSVYGGGSKEVKKERGKREMPSKLVARFKSCHGPSIPAKHAGRKKRAPSRRRGPPIGMTRCGGCDEGIRLSVS